MPTVASSAPLEGGVFMLGEGGVGCVIEGEGGVWNSARSQRLQYTKHDGVQLAIISFLSFA